MKKKSNTKRSNQNSSTDDDSNSNSSKSDYSNSNSTDDESLSDGGMCYEKLIPDSSDDEFNGLDNPIYTYFENNYSRFNHEQQERYDNIIKC